MASPNMRALRAKLDGLSATEEVLVPHPDTPNRAQRRHFATKEGRIVNTVIHPTWTDRFREQYRVQRWNAAQEKETAE